jgi:hypothetical protein
LFLQSFREDKRLPQKETKARLGNLKNNKLNLILQKVIYLQSFYALEQLPQKIGNSCMDGEWLSENITKKKKR